MAITLFAVAIMVLLLATAFVPNEPSLGSLTDEAMPLQVSEIRIYEYDRNDIDYHTGKLTISTIPQGSDVAVNGLVINHNHRGEHFDYITMIIDSDEYTEYLHVRPGVAVPLGGQTGIDSETSSVVLDKAGNYTVKVFTWSTSEQGTPIALSDGASKSIAIVE